VLRDISTTRNLMMTEFEFIPLVNTAEFVNTTI
jgi:hypothetical protein